MKNSVTIIKIRSLLESGEDIALAHVDKELMFIWFHPEDILGMNKKKILSKNRKLFFPKLNTNVDSQKVVLNVYEESDDEVIIEYLQECISQRTSLALVLCEHETVLPLQHLGALLYMLVEFETQINFTDLDREAMTVDDYDMALKMIETIVSNESREHIKQYLVDFTFYLFCYSYISPELDTLPELQSFLDRESSKERLDKLKH